MDINLKIVSKIIKSINGTMYISSEINKGTEVLITLDQYIREDKNNKRNDIVENYVRTRSNDKKVLIINDDEKEIRIIRKKLEEIGYDVSSSMFAIDGLKRIKNGEKFELILIDDEMSLMNSLTLLKELKKLKDKSQKIVLLDSSKKFIGHHYIKEGFNDYIDKSQLLEEVESKCNK